MFLPRAGQELISSAWQGAWRWDYRGEHNSNYELSTEHPVEEEECRHHHWTLQWADVGVPDLLVLQDVRNRTWRAPVTPSPLWTPQVCVAVAERPFVNSANSRLLSCHALLLCCPGGQTSSLSEPGEGPGWLSVTVSFAEQLWQAVNSPTLCCFTPWLPSVLRWGCTSWNTRR